jgi:hypothetical protein
MTTLGEQNQMKKKKRKKQGLSTAELEEHPQTAY